MLDQHALKLSMAQRTNSIADLEKEAQKNKLLGKRKAVTEQGEV